MEKNILTKLYKVNPKIPDKKIIEAAAREIIKGNTVVFPTETVYGLGANGMSEKAIAKIFKAKNRPQDNPLILHVNKFDKLYDLGEVNSDLKNLAEHFWPGPLTVILKKNKSVPTLVSAGLDTVAVRIPSHPVALALIEESGVAIAAPSANLSGKLSPTRAEHVIEDLWGRVNCIIDGGPTGVGVESTVLDMSLKPYKILRPGGITPCQIERILDTKVELYVPDIYKNEKPSLSPGLKYKHYAPKAPLLLVEGENLERVGLKIKTLGENYKNKGLKVGVLITDEMMGYFNKNDNEFLKINSLGPANDLKQAAKNLYKRLRELDDKGVDVIIARSFQEEGMGLALSNRLKKAAGNKIFKA